MDNTPLLLQINDGAASPIEETEIEEAGIGARANSSPGSLSARLQVELQLHESDGPDKHVRLPLHKWYHAFCVCCLPLIAFTAAYLSLSTRNSDVLPRTRRKTIIGWILVVAGFVIRDMGVFYSTQHLLVQKRECLLKGTGHVPLGQLGRLFLGQDGPLTPDMLVDFLTGRTRPFLWWQLRGVGPVSVFTGGLFAAVGYYAARSLDESDFVPWLMLECMFAMTGFAFGMEIRSIYVPYHLVCIQVGGALKERIGLHNRSDPALQALQSLSFSISVPLSFAVTLLAVGIFLIGMPIGIVVFFIVAASVTFMGILFAPIRSTVRALAEQKQLLLAETSVLVDAQHEIVLTKFKLRGDHQSELVRLKDLVEYHNTTAAISIIPSGLRLLQTATVSVLVMAGPPVVAWVSFRSSTAR
jgi:uncharacterized membrane protein YiaA